VRKGAPWLKPVLVPCAWAASRKKNSYFEAQFLRIKARRGPNKAVVAVAASMLTAAYHMVSDGTCYQELGADYFARRDPRRSWPSSQAGSAALAMTSSLTLQRLQHDVASFW
jgi:hypothetical protein